MVPVGVYTIFHKPIFHSMYVLSRECYVILYRIIIISSSSSSSSDFDEYFLSCLIFDFSPNLLCPLAQKNLLLTI